MSPDDMGMGLKSCVAVYLLEMVRLLQYKWGTIFRQEWFWKMEELTKRNGKGGWTPLYLSPTFIGRFTFFKMVQLNN